MVISGRHPEGRLYAPTLLGPVINGLKQARNFPPLVYLELILTDRCNMRCRYCFEADKDTHEMSDETAFRAIDFLMEHSRETRKLTVLFFGGEPLLRFDLIQKVVAYANDRASALGRKVSYDTTTNGTLLNAQHLRFFRDNRIKFLLSLDGGKEDHDRNRRTAGGEGTFDLLRKNIPLFKRYQPWLGAKMTILPETALNLRRNIEELWGLGINQFIVGYGHGVEWTVKDLLNYEQGLREACELYLEMKYHKRWFRMSLFEEGELGGGRNRPTFGCGAGRGRFCVDSDGVLWGCSKLATIRGMHNGVLPLGDVHRGLTQVENRKQLNILSVGPRAKCRGCEFRDVCAGGCPALNHVTTGSVFDPDDVSCRIVFITQRVHAYMAQRFQEVFGHDMNEAEPAQAGGRKTKSA